MIVPVIVIYVSVMQSKSFSVIRCVDLVDLATLSQLPADTLFTAKCTSIWGVTNIQSTVFNVKCNIEVSSQF